jgi:hypothetical protein
MTTEAPARDANAGPAAQPDAHSGVESRMQSLLALIDGERKRQCAAILAEARSRAAATLRDAHADARSRIEKAFAEERLRRDARLGAERANLQTRLRLAAQRHAAALLAFGWTRVPDLLRGRWRDADARREWAASVASAARKTLPTTTWRVEHAACWPADEREAFANDPAGARRFACTFATDPHIAAGLRIVEGGNIVDGTLDGLLCDRSAIGSRLLRLLDGVEAPQRSSAATARLGR